MRIAQRLHIDSTLSLLVVAALGAVAPLLLGDTTLRCGYVVDVVCPGCSPNNPGACACVAQRQSCNCSTTAYLVTCEHGYFDWVGGDIHIINDGPMEPCQFTYKCCTPSGGHLNCATYDNGLCLSQPPPVGGCSWHLLANPTEARTFVETAEVCTASKE